MLLNPGALSQSWPSNVVCAYFLQDLFGACGQKYSQEHIPSAEAPLSGSAVLPTRGRAVCLSSPSLPALVPALIVGDDGFFPYLRGCVPFLNSPPEHFHTKAGKAAAQNLLAFPRHVKLALSTKSAKLNFSLLQWGDNRLGFQFMLKLSSPASFCASAAYTTGNRLEHSFYAAGLEKNPVHFLGSITDSLIWGLCLTIHQPRIRSACTTMW